MKVIKLSKKTSVIIRPIPPFNFDGTVYVPHHFSTPDFEWKPGVLWRSMNFYGKLYGLRMENKGTLNIPKIRLTLYSRNKLPKEVIDAVISELNWRYGFNEDLTDFFDEFKNDKLLSQTFKKLKGMRVSSMNSLYEFLMISIVLQNATVRRTVQMMNNLLGKYGNKIEFDGRILAVFWNPKDIINVKESELRLLKVGYRDKMIKKISESFAKREIDEFVLRQMPNEAAQKEIIKLYGVGPATAQMLTAEYLRRHDVFDLKGRVWEQKILSRIMFNKNLVPPEKIIKMLENKYGNWKGLAAYYMFTDLFWKHKEKKIDWLEKEIRL